MIRFDLSLRSNRCNLFFVYAEKQFCEHLCIIYNVLLCTSWHVQLTADESITNICLANLGFSRGIAFWKIVSMQKISRRSRVAEKVERAQHTLR